MFLIFSALLILFLAGCAGRPGAAKEQEPEQPAPSSPAAADSRPSASAPPDAGGGPNETGAQEPDDSAAAQAQTLLDAILAGERKPVSRITYGTDERDAVLFSVSSRVWLRRYTEVFGQTAITPVKTEERMEIAFLASEVLRFQIILGDEQDAAREMTVSPNGMITIRDTVADTGIMAEYTLGSAEAHAAFLSALSSLEKEMTAEDAGRVLAAADPAVLHPASTAVDVRIRNAASTPFQIPAAWRLERRLSADEWEDTGHILTLMEHAGGGAVPSRGDMFYILSIPEGAAPEEGEYRLVPTTESAVAPVALAFRESGERLEPSG